AASLAAPALAPALSLSPALSAPAATEPYGEEAPPPDAAGRRPPAAAPAVPPNADPVLPGLGAPAERLEALFAELDARWPLPADSPAAGVRARVRAQLLAASRSLSAPEPELLARVAVETDRALAKIQRRLDAGEIDPGRTVRTAPSDARETDAGRARIGVYPVAADPFQWGHLLVALRAVGDLGLDKVVFVLAGDDPRKPALTPALRRHPMGLEVLKAFAPFFEYSPIAVGTTLDGETNVFRLLALNRGRAVDAWYMVGDDHYRLVDKNGNPDTLPKLERNLRERLGHDEALHQLKVAFIRREGGAAEVPTSLEVRFLDHVGFDASSTQVRRGRHALMPYAAYDYARREGLYGLDEPPKPDGD
ncbi:MAG: hypothetical protein KGM24_08270, partial [Elusimicrobia bacterium]|nr:hypothetical protein [Elusimicrobiota bacterium]